MSKLEKKVETAYEALLDPRSKSMDYQAYYDLHLAPIRKFIEGPPDGIQVKVSVPQKKFMKAYDAMMTIDATNVKVGVAKKRSTKGDSCNPLFEAPVDVSYKGIIDDCQTIISTLQPIIEEQASFLVGSQIMESKGPFRVSKEGSKALKKVDTNDRSALGKTFVLDRESPKREIFRKWLAEHPKAMNTTEFPFIDDFYFLRTRETWQEFGVCFHFVWHLYLKQGSVLKCNTNDTKYKAVKKIVKKWQEKNMIDKKPPKVIAKFEKKFSGGIGSPEPLPKDFPNIGDYSVECGY